MEIRGREPTDPGDLVDIKDDTSGVGGHQLGQSNSEEGADTALCQDWQHGHDYRYPQSSQSGVFLVRQDDTLLHF